MATNYNPALKELVDKKAKIRMALRSEFIKQVYNPHRHATGEGGFVFDPAHQRYLSMTVNRYRFFKYTGKTSLLGLGLIVLPSAAFINFVMNQRHKLEEQLRTGQVAYKDRWNKFL